MKQHMLLSLMVLLLFIKQHWAGLRKLPSTFSFPSVELVAIGDGYLLSVVGRTDDID